MLSLSNLSGGGGGGGIRLNEERSSVSPKRFNTVKKFYKFIFTLFEIVLHVLKFSFVFIRCHGSHFFQLVTELRNKQSHLDSMILARLHSNLVGG